MSFLVVLHTPLMLLLPIAGSVDARDDISGDPETAIAEPVQADPGEPQIQHALPESENGTADNFREYRTFRVFAQSFRVSGANQARIEQRMTIRVTAREAVGSVSQRSLSRQKLTRTEYPGRI